MALKPDLLGTKSEPYEFAWSADDVMLYALAVGAGHDDPREDLQFTTENTARIEPAVLPTYANIITRGARVRFGDYEPAKLVHAEQSFRLHAPLPVAGKAITTATVTEVNDKGSGALIATEAQAVDADTGAALATSVQSVFIRGEGGFGGPRGTSTRWEVPAADSDYEVPLTIRPEQALLYRLTGDRNPLHSDPSFAKQGGFPRPILHGMCTYGFTGRALLDAVCNSDPSRFGAMQARFTKPVFPGDQLVVSVWQRGPTAYFRTSRDGEVVLDRGILELNNND